MMDQFDGMKKGDAAFIVDQIATARAILSSGDDWRSVVDAESVRKDTER